jgi:hypothetical protein
MPIKLTRKQQIVLNRYARGGVRELATLEYTASRKTILALIRAGHLDSRGLTPHGRAVADPNGPLV